MSREDETDNIVDPGSLSRIIPIFPLSGVLLLPRGLLPLNIFEPRYLAMTRDALAGSKLIGMIQPAEHNSRGREPETYAVGCVGEIASAADTPDGRILITLRGLCRFAVEREIEVETMYRQVEADYSRFSNDMVPADGGQISRDRLLNALRAYCTRHSLPADWDSINAASDELLVHSLCMICPFTPGEKQALLEAADFTARAEMLITLLEMALLDSAGPQQSRNLH